MASFVLKPAHFEFQSYGGAWHTIICIKNYPFILRCLDIFEIKVVEKEVIVNVFWQEQKFSGLENRSKFQMF